MCITYTWKYSCGCLAPKPPSKPITYCSLQSTCNPNLSLSPSISSSSSQCQLKPLYSYLQSPCQQNCYNFSSDDYDSYEEYTSYAHYGRFRGMTSAEDKHFGRSRSPISEREGGVRGPEKQKAPMSLGKMLWVEKERRGLENISELWSRKGKEKAFEEHGEDEGYDEDHFEGHMVADEGEDFGSEVVFAQQNLLVKSDGKGKKKGKNR